MAKQFQVEILTPEKTIFAGQISSLVVPAALGYLGVLAGHAPLVANLTPGKIHFNPAAAAQKGIINNRGQGFLEVTKNKVTLLLDSAD